MLKTRSTLIVATVVACATVLSGCTLGSKTVPATIPEGSAAPAAQEMTGEMKGYTLAEISSHSTKADCWMAIEGKVYDVTKAIDMHPGGDDILAGCGKDATSLFNARPGEHNTPHSPKASAMLSQFEIGTLQP